jgi:hypothetical protein
MSDVRNGVRVRSWENNINTDFKEIGYVDGR